MPATKEQLEELQKRNHRRDVAARALYASEAIVSFAEGTQRCVRDLIIASDSPSDLETGAKLIIEIGSVLVRANGMQARHSIEVETARRLADEWAALVERESDCTEGCVLHGKHAGDCLEPTAAEK